MEVFVERSVGKIRKLLGRRDKDKELRQSCDEVLSHLKASTPNLSEETYITPLFQAILTKNNKITCLALDCLEKLLAFGYMRGSAPITSNLQVQLQQALNLNEDNMNMTPKHKVLLIDAVVEVICSCQDHTDNDVQLQVLKAVLTAVTCTTCKVHEHSLLKSIRASYHIYLVSKSVINQTVAKGTLQRMVSSTFQRMESANARPANPTALYASVQVLFGFQMKRQLESFPTVWHKDAYLVFRALCRISMRFVMDDAVGDAPDEPQADDPFALQSKMISLELLLSIINQAGSTFLSNERFLVAIRSYLCVSLLQNCTSIYTQVVELSLRVFVVLITHFKAHLKGEMEVFITNIFLRILDSENSTFEHKMLVLEVLNHICDDQLILSEIFLNYDCDWDSMDLFKRIVNALAKIAKSKHHTGTPTARQLKLQQNEAALVLKGLECLTSTVHSLKKAANFVSIRSQTKTTTENDSDNEDESVSPRLPSSTVLVVEVFDKKKKRQDLLSTGIVKFNVKATDGVKFCTSNNLIENTPRAVAQFLHQYNNKLDKFQIGEYLGRESAYQNGFCVKVLHEFVDMMDFHELELDEAIRSYLSYFRLPGEAQKIDRMMEKFAERYHLNNPGVFPSADVAFILSFSVIMLQTDLHNPSIPEEKKMTKEGFLRNNRGINNGEDLPPEYLGGIYDRIKSTPISLKEEQTMKLKRESSTFTVSAAVLDKQRKEAFGREREAMVKSSEAFFKRKSPSNRKNVDKTKSPLSFHVVSNTAENVHVKPMFEIVWAPLLAVCSVIFETSDHPVAVQYCLDGFKHAIHLSARLQMHSERDAYVSVLANFTAVQHSATRAIATKQIEAIKTLIAIAVKEGNFLGDAWRDVLQCISHLARLQLHAQGLHSDTQFFVSPANSRASIASNGSSKRMGSLGMLISNPFNPNSFPSPKFKPQALPDDQLAANEALNAQQILDQIDGLAIDRVFSNSALLSDNSVQEFVQQLCIVSLTECQGLSGVGVTVRLTSLSLPRVFSLQKLVEVADMNMHVRSRVVWASIWSVLSRHFTTIGCHDNLSLAMYAIDSLKQLSMKFLEKDELRDFNFQRLFLAPFEIIMGNAVSMEIRELVLSCVHNMILSRVDNIKSGWKTIWGVLRVAAETFDPTEKADRVVLMGFMLAKTIVDTHFDRVVTVFLDLIECVLAFALCGSTEESSSRSLVEMSLDATNVLGLCLGYVASGRVIEQIEAHAAAAIMSPRNRAVNTLPPDQLHYTDQESHTHIWRPVLHALATLASDPLIEVRETAIDTLYGSLHMHGSTIDASLWHMIFRDILVPLMESIRKVELQEKISFNRKTSKKALLALVHLYGTFYPSIGHVDEILELLKRWMVREAEDELACAAALSYEHLLIQHGHQFEPEIWELITSEIEAIQRNLLPLWLVEDHKEHSNPGMYPAVSKLLFTKHVELEKVPSLTHMTVLLETQRICSNVLVQVHSSLPSSCFDAVLTCLKESFDFARRLNDDYKIRLLLFQKGWRYGSQSAKELPHMLAQEIMGKREYLKVVCHHLADFRGDFTELVQTCLKEYLLWSQEGDAFSLSMDQRQRSYGYVPLIVDILEAISKFPEDEVLRHLAWLYPLLTELIQTNSIEVRRALFLVFNSSIQMLLLLLLPHKS